MQTTHCLGPLLLGDLATLNPNPRSIASSFWSPHHKVSGCPQPTLPSLWAPVASWAGIRTLTDSGHRTWPLQQFPTGNPIIPPVL